MEILIPITLFIMIAAIVIVPGYFKSLERQKMADTLRAAIERGEPLPQEVVNALSSNVKPPQSPARDLRTGIIWLGVAIGMAGFGIALGFGGSAATYPLIACAAFPGFIGLAFVALGLINRKAV